MTKQNNRKALGASFLAILLCLTMLIGATFAWFTDNDTTAVSNIVSGTLDIEIVDAQGNPKTDALKFVAKDNRDTILWEPGATYRTEGFQIKNIGNLWLKYTLKINNTETSYNKLNEAIKFSLVKADGEKIDLATMKDISLAPAGGTDSTVSDVMYIEGHMDENAGNEYQGLTLEGVWLSVQATQWTEEFDSFNNTYDKDATYAPVEAPKPPIYEEAGGEGQPATVHITSAEGLRTFAETVNNGEDKTVYQNKTIVLDNDIDLSGENWTPINGWDGVLNGATIDGQGHTIKNMTVKNMTVDGSDKLGFIGSNSSSVTIQNLVFENAYVKSNETGSSWSGVVIGYNYAGNTIKNVTVKNSKVISNWQAGGLVGINSEHPMTFEDCKIENSFVGGYNCTAGAIYGMGSVDVTLTNCSATNVNLYTDGMEWDSTQKSGGQYLLVGHVYGKTATLTNCTVTNVSVVSEYPSN